MAPKSDKVLALDTIAILRSEAARPGMTMDRLRRQIDPTPSSDTLYRGLAGECISAATWEAITKFARQCEAEAHRGPTYLVTEPEVSRFIERWVKRGSLPFDVDRERVRSFLAELHRTQGHVVSFNIKEMQAWILEPETLPTEPPPGAT